MPLEWMHRCDRADCTGDTDCPAFPTVSDRMAMAEAAFNEYSEADGTTFTDFVHDVMMLAIRRGVDAEKLRMLVTLAQFHASDAAAFKMPEVGQ
jgi:hypothetical protein